MKIIVGNVVVDVIGANVPARHLHFRGKADIEAV
jgi:hypothetical protein